MAACRLFAYIEYGKQVWAASARQQHVRAPATGSCENEQLVLARKECSEPRAHAGVAAFYVRRVNVCEREAGWRHAMARDRMFRRVDVPYAIVFGNVRKRVHQRRNTREADAYRHEDEEEEKADGRDSAVMAGCCRHRHRSEVKERLFLFKRAYIYTVALGASCGRIRLSTSVPKQKALEEEEEENLLQPMSASDSAFVRFCAANNIPPSHTQQLETCDPGHSTYVFRNKAWAAKTLFVSDLGRFRPNEWRWNRHMEAASHNRIKFSTATFYMPEMSRIAQDAIDFYAEQHQARVRDEQRPQRKRRYNNGAHEREVAWPDEEEDKRVVHEQELMDAIYMPPPAPPPVPQHEHDRASAPVRAVAPPMAAIVLSEHQAPLVPPPSAMMMAAADALLVAPHDAGGGAPRLIEHSLSDAFDDDILASSADALGSPRFDMF